MQRGVMGISEQDRRKRVSFIRIAQARVRNLGSHIAREVENASRIVRLPEVIKEHALFATELDGMSSFYPLQSR